jgi:hypothetical protein
LPKLIETQLYELKLIFLLYDTLRFIIKFKSNKIFNNTYTSVLQVHIFYLKI